LLMSEPAKNLDRMIVTLTESELDAIIEAAVERALAKKKPARLQFTTKEAAEALHVKYSWLAVKARAGEVPHRRPKDSNKVFFTQQDIDEILAQYAVHGKS
jgi:hypothetical protein